MGIEQSFERIANSLERSVAIWEELLEISRWNKVRLEEQGGAPAAPVEDKGTAAGSSGASMPDMDYDTLKAELKARGYSVSKGMRMTTLLKMWEKHKDEPYVIDPNMSAMSAPPTAPAAPAAPAAPTAPATPATPAAPAAPDVSNELFDGEPTGASEKKPMTAKEVRSILEDEGAATQEGRQYLFAAFAHVGATRFSEVRPEDYETVLGKFRSLKAGAKNE